tara:strand:+ start:31950 stop:33830 length:1881 start_codon:yes stop_codon:yes gene_type:complete
VYKKVLITGLTSLPVRVVRSVLMANDIGVLFVALTATHLMLFGMDFPVSYPGIFWLYLTVGLSALIMIMAFRLQRIKLVMLSSGDVLNIARANLAIMLCLMIVSFGLEVPHALALSLTFGVFSFAGMVGARAVAVSVFGRLREHLHKRQTVAVFGAGPAGIQLASALSQSSDMRPVAFFDDNPTMHGMEMGGIPVCPPKDLIANMFRQSISKLIIALPESAKARQQAIVDMCIRADIDVQILPSFIDLLDRGNERLRTVDPDEILGRNKVDLETPEVAKSYAGRVVMVTGAGGSIGSELCRQLIACRPAKIVLFEQSEYNLYVADLDLIKRTEVGSVEICSRLGSVTDPVRLRQVIDAEKVEIILHAAAYKHVPLVEGNELEGARNNILGTKILADAAVAAGIERFILVSTDKAVRPTSVMGATKRLAELIVQDVQTRAAETKFAMVRFGNVLGSSGSVLPLFQSQIEAGGPVTVTHPEMSRYFMAVSEAARLVLLAGAYAEGGDVFVLDMGKPQKIIALARKLIHLSGRRVKDPVTGEGDIEIKITGLRPGEKLYEELFVDADSLCKTPHPKILRAEEAHLSEIQIAGMLREVQAAIEGADPEKLRKVAMERVDGYTSTQMPLKA